MKKLIAFGALALVAVVAFATQAQRQYDDPPPCILTNTCGMTGNGGPH